MEKFLIKTLLFGAIFFLLNLLPNLFSNPYSGNKYYLSKYKYFINNQDKFNTIILGSSRLYRQINPNILDLALKDYKISTFNLATPATYNPEVYYLYEKLLKMVAANSIKYAFVELQPLSEISSKNLNTSRNFYWHNLEYLCFSINYTLSSNKTLRQKREYIKQYSISYLNKIINFFYRYKTIIYDESSENNLFLGKNKDGFYPLNEEMEDTGEDNGLRKRLTIFFEDTTVLKKRVAMANQAFSEKSNEYFFNEVHFKKLIQLIDKSKKKGIHLIFIIPPRTECYNELISLKERLPDSHIIELANPEKYPELYRVEFSFDSGHLNKEGATVFTKYLAVKLLKNASILSRNKN